MTGKQLESIQLIAGGWFTANDNVFGEYLSVCEVVFHIGVTYQIPEHWEKVPFLAMIP